MSIKKTLGGDRLGSGSKMQVELHGYERSTHDKSYIWRSTMSAGTLVPCIKELALPGDTFDINLDIDIKTHPTIGPLFGSYKVQLDVFQAPIRLYNALLHNNALDIGRNMEKVKFPQLQLKANPLTLTDDIDNAQINPSSLIAYLGVRGVGRTMVPNVPREFNAIPVLAYWDIYKNYYANKQEEIGAVLHTPNPPIVETVDNIMFSGVPQAPGVAQLTIAPNTLLTIGYAGAQPDPRSIYINTLEHGWINFGHLGNWYEAGPSDLHAHYTNDTYGTITAFSWRYKNADDPNNSLPIVQTFVLADIDTMRKKILAYDHPTNPFLVNSEPTLTPYRWLHESNNGTSNLMSSQEGLGLKTYQSDLFNNWLSTEWIDGSNGINEISAVDVSDGKLKIDALNLSKKVYDMLNRIAVSGGTYNDWLDAVYAHHGLHLVSSPIYHGGLIKELIFQEVVSNNATNTSDSGEQPIGTLAGRGVMGKKHKGGTVVVKVDEPSYIIGIISLTPRVDYSQGNDWDVHLKTMDDLHKPALDEIGFQDLIIEQMAWWDTNYDAVSGVWRQHSAGKQPAWINYMTSVNKVYGNFAQRDNEMFMTLNRRYEWSGNGVDDLTTYIDPAKFNHIFAETAIDAQNFWAQIAVDMIVRRKMSAKLMPNL